MIKDNKSYRILAIEDNPGDFVLIEDYLQERIEKPEIIYARDYKSGRNHMTSGSSDFDVILLDLSLPDKDGYDLVIDALKHSGATPLIVLTGNNSIEFSIQSISFGVSDYLLKDELTADSLYKSITYSIERKKVNRKLIESELRFSNLFHQSPQPTWVCEKGTYKIIQVNKAAVEHYGYTSDEFCSMTIFNLNPGDEPIVRDISLLASAGMKTDRPFTGRIRHKKKTGEMIDVEMYSSDIIINDKIFNFVIAIDITEKLRFENRLTKAIIKTQEDERYEIGSELHDNVCQIIASVQMFLGMLIPHLNPQGRELLNQCQGYTNMAINEARNLSHRLAPAFFEGTTFADAVHMLVKDFTMGSDAEIRVNIDKHINPDVFHRDLQLNLFRIFQEQLRNIQKYARAKNIEISMVETPGWLKMSIRDNGQGFDINKSKRGIGFANMKRRAELFEGNMQVNTSPGNGCEVVIEIPVS